MNKKERESLLKLLDEMGKDDIINMLIHIIEKFDDIDVYQFLEAILEQDHVSDNPYTWIDYANRGNNE